MPTATSTARRTATDAVRAADPATETGAGFTDAHPIEPFDEVRESQRPSSSAMHAGRAVASGDVASLARQREIAPGDGARDGRTVHAPHPAAGTTQPDSNEPLGPDDPLAPLPFNPYKGNRGITRAWHAMKNSLAGFQVAIREESAFRQELTLAAILLPIGMLVPVEPVSRVLLISSVLLVLIVELLNSSVEAAIDRISLERHELSRRAKDLGSAAVMVALGVCVLTWALLVGPLVVHWVRGLH